MKISIAEQVDNLPKELQPKVREVLASTMKNLARSTEGLDPLVRNEIYRLATLTIQENFLKV